MRLIDAYALIKEFEGYMLDPKELRDAICTINDAPTVDAVPVEWIEQYKQSIGSQTVVGYRWIENMQKAWAERKEE